MAGSGSFFVPRCNTAKGRKTVDASLNEIAPLVGFVIVIDRRCAFRSRWNQRLDAALVQIVSDRVAVIALVAEKPVGIDVLKRNQRLRVAKRRVFRLSSIDVAIRTALSRRYSMAARLTSSSSFGTR
jgi:hypothetical protein